MLNGREIKIDYPNNRPSTYTRSTSMSNPLNKFIIYVANTPIYSEEEDIKKIFQ